MVPRYQRDKDMFEKGFSGNTIIMDPDFQDMPNDDDEQKPPNAKNLLIKEIGYDQGDLQVPEEPL